MMACSCKIDQPMTSGRRELAMIMGATLTLPGWTALAGCAMGGRSVSGPASNDYAAAMRQALRAVTGDLPGYHFRASPVGNFGVGSIYLDELAGGDLKTAESGWFLGNPDSWLVAGPNAVERQRWLGRLVAEGSMGAFHSDSAAQRGVNVQAALALIAVLAGGAGVDAGRAMEARFDATEVRQRRLNWAEFDAALRAGQVAPEVAQVVRSGRFVVAAADVVLVGYQAEIAIDGSRNPQLAASLRSKALSLAGAGGSVSLRITERSRGRFAVSAPQPVVAAVLFKRPPTAVAKGGSGPPLRLDDWPDAGVSDKAAQATERRVLERSGL